VIRSREKWSESAILKILSPVRLPFRHTGNPATTRDRAGDPCLTRPELMAMQTVHSAQQAADFCLPESLRFAQAPRARTLAARTAGSIFRDKRGDKNQPPPQFLQRQIARKLGEGRPRRRMVLPMVNCHRQWSSVIS